MRFGTLAGPVTRYTRFVLFGKSFLWLLIAFVVGTVIWTASGDKGENASRLVFSSVTPNEHMQPEMINPNYQGLDAKNNPYTVAADKAIQKDKDTVTLIGIRADMQQANGTWLALNSGSGEMNMKTRMMLLMGGVNMFYEGGYEFETDHAQVDINKGTAYGDTVIKGQGPMGTLQAKSFEVEDRGRIIRFKGSVKLKIYR